MNYIDMNAQYSELTKDTKGDWELDDIIDYPVAVVADLATTTVNSLTSFVTGGYGGTEFKTDELLSNIGLDDAARFYDEHTDAVQLTSFVAGVLVPGLGMAKVLSAAKAGKMGVLGSKFERMNKNLVGYKDEALRIRGTSIARTQAEKDAIRQMYIQTGKMAVAENLAYEVGMASLMNQHSYLDEYSLGDAALGMALGTAISAPIMLWGARGALKEGQIAVDVTQAERLGDTLFRKFSSGNVPLGNSAAYYKALATDQLEQMRSGLRPDEIAVVENRLMQTKDEMRRTLINAFPETDRAAYSAAIAKEELTSLEDFDVMIAKGADVFSDKVTDVEVLAHLLNEEAASLMGVSKVGRFTGKASGISPEFTDYFKVEKTTGNLDILDTDLGQLLKEKHAGKSTAFADYKHGANGLVNIIVRKETTMEDVINTMTLQGLQGRAIKIVPIGKKPQAMKDLENELSKLVPDAASASWVDELMQNKLFTEAEALTQYGASHAKQAAVIDTWTGKPTIINSVLAKLSQGIADYGGLHPKVKSAESYVVSGKSAYDPLTNSVWQSDSEFFAANIKVRNVTKGDMGGKPREYLVDADDLPRLQAIRNSAINKQDFYISHGDWGKNQINGIRDLDIAINKARAKHVKAMRDGGHSDLVIMKATNTTPEALERLQAGGYKAEALEGGTATSYRYDEAGSEKYTNINQLQLKGDEVRYYDKWNSYRQAAETDRASIEKIFARQQEIIIDEAIALGTTPIVKDIAEQLLPQEALLKPLLKELESAAITGTNFFSSNVQSFDQSLRNASEMLGPILSTMGANLKTAANTTIKRFQDKIHIPLNAINNNNAARTAFYYLRQANDGLDSKLSQSMRYDEGAGKFLLKEATEDSEATYLKLHGTDEDWVVQGQSKELIENFLKEWLPIQDELFETGNIVKRLQGAKTINRRGLWFPYGKLDEANIAYRINSADPTDVALIRARGADELKTKLANLQKNNSSAHISYVTRDDLGQQWNSVHKRAELDNLGRADSSAAKSGVVFDEIPADGRGIQEILDGLQEAVWSRSRGMVEYSMPDTMNSIKSIIKEQEAAFKSTKGTPFQKLGKNVTAANKAYAALMNYDTLPDSALLTGFNNAYSATVDSIASGVTQLVGKHHLGDIDAQTTQYNSFLADLAKENIPNPFKDLTDYVQSLAPGGRSVALETTQKVNSATAVFALRFFDLSHAAVTAMSMPVILAGELSSKSYSALDNGATMPIKYMMKGIKLAMKRDAEGAGIMDRAKDLGYTRAQIAETTDAFRDMHLKPDMMDKLTDSKAFTDIIAKPADWMEGMVREVSYATGYSLARDKFPNATAPALEAWAHNFTNRTMGNYITKQRPALFQGAFGSAIGLFQTFMLTMGQNLVRYTEKGDTKAVAALMGGQAAMFGMGSLPGYDQMNHFIGEYINDQSHTDLTSFTERVFGSSDNRDMAEFMLYGFPSTLTQAALYTRAELQPRSPIGVTQEGAVSLGMAGYSAMFNVAKDMLTTGQRVITESTSGGDILDMGRAVREGLAMQTLFRPLARFTELAQGYSQDRTGQVVDTDTFDGLFPVMARVMGSRPLQEQALRQLKFENSYYNQASQQKRKDYAKIMRSSVASDSEYDQAAIGQRYLDSGGSPEGLSKVWNDAYLYNLEGSNYADRITREAGNKGPMIDIMSNYST